MTGLSVSCFLICLFASLDTPAQKRPVGYLDPSVLENARQQISYNQWHVMERSITLLNNEDGLVPVRDVQPGMIAVVSIWCNEEFEATKTRKANHYNAFLYHVSNYTPASLFLLPNDTRTVVLGEVIARLESFPRVIVGLLTG